MKGQKIGWETIGLTEFMTTAVHFGSILEQDRKQKSAKLLTLQLQQLQVLAAKITPGSSTSHSHKHHQNAGPGIGVSLVIN